MRKQQIVGILLVLVMLVTGACSPKTGGGPVPTLEKTIPGPLADKPGLTREQQLIEGAKKEGQVVFWTQSWPTEVAEPFRQAFEAKYPFLQFRAWDSPTAQDAIIRLTEEAKVGRNSVDVVLFAETDIVAAQSPGLLQAQDWPKGWSGQPSHKYWANIAFSTYAPVYNTDLVSAAEAPKSFEDIKNAKWRGKAAMTTSGRGVPLYTAWIFGGGKLDFAKSDRFWLDVVANTKPRKMSGQEGTLALLAAGEFSIMLIGAVASTNLLLWKGAPLGLAAIDAAPVFGYSLALLKNPPHPNAAQLLLDFFTGPEGNLIYANGKGIGAYNLEVGSKAKANATYKLYGLKLVTMPAEIYTDDNTARASTFWTQDLWK